MTEINLDGLDRFRFGDSPSLADELAALVLAGMKTATCWSASDGLLTEVGKLMIMCDGAGTALAVVQTTELTQRRSTDVDAAFAFDEGENDRTLDGWRSAHRRYFTRLGTFEPDMLLYCERFRVVARLNASGGRQDESTALDPPRGEPLETNF